MCLRAPCVFVCCLNASVPEKQFALLFPKQLTRWSTYRATGYGLFLFCVWPRLRRGRPVPPPASRRQPQKGKLIFIVVCHLLSLTDSKRWHFSSNNHQNWEMCQSHYHCYGQLFGWSMDRYSHKTSRVIPCALFTNGWKLVSDRADIQGQIEKRRLLRNTNWLTDTRDWQAGSLLQRKRHWGWVESSLLYFLLFSLLSLPSPPSNPSSYACYAVEDYGYPQTQISKANYFSA